MNVKLETISSGYDYATCWVHPRAGVFKTDSVFVMTMSKLFLSRSDCFSGLFEMKSFDKGLTWSSPKPIESLAPKYRSGEILVLCDATPKYHEITDKLLLTGSISKSGKTTNYSSNISYSVLSSPNCEWSPWDCLNVDGLNLDNATAGSGQRVDLEDGNILLPISYRDRGRFCSCVLKCGFDGQRLQVIEKGTSLSLEIERGLYEPSLISYNGRYFLTLRNDISGYVAVSDDGLNFNNLKKWTFDNGQDLGNYNTQQHWVVLSGKLYLVYTRRGLDNDHVFRHRAPLLVGQVDDEKLCIVRSSEKIIVPERGARLGNFGVTEIDADESWVTVAEWMQNDNIGYHIYDACNKYGSNGDVFIAKLSLDKL